MARPGWPPLPISGMRLLLLGAIAVLTLARAQCCLAQDRRYPLAATSPRTPTALGVEAPARNTAYVELLGNGGCIP